MSADVPIGQNGEPVISDDRLEHVITGRRRKSARKALFLVVAFILVGILGFGTFLANAIGKIKVANFGGGSPLLSLVGLNPNSLKGEGDGRINVLLLGIGGAKHPGGQLTDTIIVASIDPKNKEAAFLSIPRDLYINYPKPLSGAGKINNVHAYGEQNKVPGGGSAVAKTAVSQLLNLPIHYFFRADFTGFEQLIDSLGGVIVTLDSEFADPLFPDEQLVGFEPFYLPAGTQKLDGENALKYARSRQTSSDFDRARRQQQIMLAIKEKALTAKVLVNPAKIAEIARIAGNHLKTDLTIKEIERLFEIVKVIPKNKIITKVLDTSPGGPLYSESTEQGYFIKLRDPSGAEVKKIAREIFKDPYIGSEAARIEIRNASDTPGLGGKLADELVELGYQVIKVSKADDQLKTSQIVDLTAGKKPVTINYLSRRLNAKIAKLTVDSTADVVVIVGQDYANADQTKTN